MISSLKGHFHLENRLSATRNTDPFFSGRDVMANVSWFSLLFIINQIVVQPPYTPISFLPVFHCN